MKFFNLIFSLALTTISAQASPGLVRDAESARTACGVGNYVFRHLVNPCTAYGEEFVDASGTITDDMTLIQSSLAHEPELLPVDESKLEAEPVFFATGSSKLSNEERSKLEMIAEILKTDPELKIVLNGHTDAQGSPELNEKLARFRAESVARELQKAGVEAAQISLQVSGSKAPLSDHSTEEGRAQNRRVDILLQ